MRKISQKEEEENDQDLSGLPLLPAHIKSAELCAGSEEMGMH